jgi:hypothetical protein
MQTRALLLYWLPWLLFMSRPSQPIARKDLPNPFRRHASQPGAQAGDIEEEKLIAGSMGWLNDIF